MIKFYIALWGCKLYLFLTKMCGKSRSDRVGILARRIDPDFLNKIKKPELVIMITGTNGKSTVTHLVNDIFRLTDKKIGFNDWNANLPSGHIRCLLDCVNVFNKSKKDVAILECDEVTTCMSIPYIKPNYVIVTNVSRDSIRRNAYPEYIYKRINDSLAKSLDTFVILNADDPISSFMGKDNKKAFVSLKNNKTLEPYKNISNDFPVCPKCNHEVVYDERYYRHIGKFHCPNCKLKSFKGDYKIEYNDKLIVNGTKYNALSGSIFNIYNQSQVIALFKELGYSDEFIVEAFEKVNITKSRENHVLVNGINVYSRLAKGQNSSAASTVFETLAKDKKQKQIVLVLDEVYDDFDIDGNETITWLYDTDFEFLNQKHINKVVVVSRIASDYKLRLLLAGVKEEKIEIVSSTSSVIPKLNLDKKTDIYVLYEVEQRPVGQKLFDDIVEFIEKEEK